MKFFSHPMSLIVAEDDWFTQRLTIAGLRQLGHCGVVVAHDRRVLDLQQKRNLELVLLNVMIPILDGVAAPRFVRAKAGVRRFRNCVLMTTAYADANMGKKLRAAGADGVIFKPFNPMPFRCELQRIHHSSIPPSDPPHQEHPS